MINVPVNIGAPSTIVLIIDSPLYSADLTTVTAVNLSVLRRDGTQTSLACTIVSATARQMIVQYQFAGGELTTTGAYQIQPLLTIPGGNIPAETVLMMVVNPFVGATQLETTTSLAATTTVYGANLRYGWGTVLAANANASPLIPFIPVDLRAGSFALTLWRGLDADVVVVADIYCAANSHALTLNAYSGQTVPDGANLGTYGSSASLSERGFRNRYKFNAALGAWIGW